MQWNSFEEYVKITKDHFKGLRDKSDQFLIDDLVGGNMNVAGQALSHAERMNWGFNVHDGMRIKYRLRKLYNELKTRDVKYEEFMELCKLTQTLSALMWQSEHVKKDGYKFAKPEE